MHRKIRDIHFFYDPRFKSIDFRNQSDCSSAVSELNRRLETVELTQQAQEQLECDSVIWKLHDTRAHSLSNPSAGLNSGLRHYLNMKVLDRKDDPLFFWKTYKSQYPQLHNLAMKYLTSLPTSCVVRDFSQKLQRLSLKREIESNQKMLIFCFLSSLPKEFI